MFKGKRKPLEEIWTGKPLNIAEIVRFTPSVCNTQPWMVENTGDVLGIFLFMLKTCMEHENYGFEKEMFEDTTDDSIEKTLIARYTYLNNQ